MNIQRQGVSALGLAVLALVLGVPTASATNLSGAINFSSLGNGTPSGGQIWNTVGGDFWYNLWISTDSAGTNFVNGPSDGQAGINIALPASGLVTYYLWAEPGTPTGTASLNLFFDGNNTTPAISAVTNGSGFTAASSGTTLSLDGTTTAGGAGLTSGLITLTNYAFHETGLSQDLVSPKAVTPSGTADFFGTFTLDITPNPTPEPSTLVLMGAGGLLSLLSLRRRKRS